MHFETLELELRNHITWVTLNRPQSLNALNRTMVRELRAFFSQLGDDQDTRLVVLCGAGRAFCAGLDLKEDGGGDGSVQASLRAQRTISELVIMMRRAPQPIIACVHGAACGGGFALALGADVRIAGESARMNAAFIRIGLSACDIGTSWLLPRLVGAARAQELMLTGRIFDADEAARIGLVTAVVADEALLDTVYAKADEIMRNTPFGVALTKEGMWSALEIPGLQAAIDLENRQQLMATATADHREAMQAFLEKRPPQYTNQ